MQADTLMTTPVTITSAALTSTVDILGRPTRGTATTRATVCRLVRTQTAIPDPNVDGLLVSVLNVYLPAGTGLTDSDVVTVGGATYQVLGAPEVLTPPVGVGYERATVRLVEDAT